jgi:O-antigen/teichoic acid export membrane protein
MPKIPKHLLVASSAWLSKGVAAFSLLATVRILTGSLSLEGYSIFVLLTSLSGWFLLLDLGVGAVVQNKISQLRANNLSYDDVVNAGAWGGVICLVISLTLLWLVSPYAGPTLLKNIHALDEFQKSMLFFMAGTFMVCQGVGGIAYKIWYGQHRGYLSNILVAIASVGGLLGLMTVATIETEIGLELSLAAFLAPTALFAITPLIWMLITTNRKMRPARLLEKIRLGVATIKSGRRFLLFALMSAGVLQIDYLVISQHLGATDIATYYIYTKVFSLGLFFYTAVLLSLWPVFAECIEKRQWKAVKAYVKKYTMIGITFMGIYTLCLIWFMPDAMHQLAPQTPIAYDLHLIVLLGIYSILRVWTDTHAIVLQSMEDMSQFWIYVPIQAALSFSIQIAAVEIWGLSGIVFALIASYLLTVAWALPARVKRLVNIAENLNAP